MVGRRVAQTLDLVRMLAQRGKVGHAPDARHSLDF